MGRKPRYTVSYKMKEAVRKRDKVCVLCGAKDGEGGRPNGRGRTLLVAHIYPVVDFPEKRNDDQNCVLLCQRCEDLYGSKYYHKADGTVVPVLLLKLTEVGYTIRKSKYRLKAPRVTTKIKKPNVTNPEVSSRAS